MESMNCAVDKNLLKLFSDEELFKNSIVDNPYSNFMCIGLMDALGLVPETLCDMYDPLSDIQNVNFCSSSTVTTLRTISNGSVFDNTSNIFIVSNFTEEHCKVVCKDDTNQLCWAFGIIAGAVLKYTQSTQVPTTAAPQHYTLPVLPALVYQDDVVESSNDGDVDKESDDSDVVMDKPENTTGENVTDDVDKNKVSNSSDIVYNIPDGAVNDDVKDNDSPPTKTTTSTGVAAYFDKNKVSNSSDIVYNIPDSVVDGDVKDNDSPSTKTTASTGVADYFNKNKISNNSENIDDENDLKEYSHEDYENKGTDTEEQPYTEDIPTVDKDQINDNQTHPIGNVQVDDNQTTDQAANLDDQSLGDTYQDDHTDQKTYEYSDPVDGNDILSTSTTTLPKEITTAAYLPHDYDYDHDHYDDDGDESGYQYLMAIVLFIFLLVAAEYLAAQKVL